MTKKSRLTKGFVRVHATPWSNVFINIARRAGSIVLCKIDYFYVAADQRPMLYLLRSQINVPRDRQFREFFLTSMLQM